MFFLVIISILVCYCILNTFRTRQNLPPGPIRWPIIGSIPQMLMEDLQYPHLQLTGLAKKYGGIMSIGFGVQYAVVVSNYEILKELFRRPETNIERFRMDYIEQRNNYQNSGLIFAHGDVWKEQRKYTIKLLRNFGFGKRNTMEDIMEAEANDLVGDIRQEIASSGGLWNVDANRLSICPINIMWASVGGYRFDPHSDTIKRHLHSTAEVLESLSPKNLLAPFPFLKVFPVLSGYKRIGDILSGCRHFMLELIDDAKQRRGGRLEPESFIEAYLDDIEKEKTNPNTYTTEEQLSLILMDLFIAGSETTSAAMNWLIFYLGINEDVQTKARAEIQEFVQLSNKRITADALSRMPYMNAVILETMRHAPFVPTALPRCVPKDIECAGYAIPKGTCLFPNFYPIFHDELFWGDPEVFRPERLLLSNGSLDPAKVERVAQFGFGARVCPGESLAMNTLFVTTTTLLRCFSFEIVPGSEPQLGPDKPSLTMKPKQFSLRVRQLGE